jgi:hypothetical protein
MANATTGDRALPKALDLIRVTSDRLCDIGGELKKRPVIQKAIHDIAADLADAADGAWPYGLESGDDLASMERLAREEVAAVAKLHVVRLPGRSGWRKKLIEVGELDHEFSVERLEHRMGEDPEEAAEGRRNAGGPPPDLVALGQLIRAITADLDDEVDARWASGLNHLADRLDRSGIDAPEKPEDVELMAVNSMRILAVHFAGLLPNDSPWHELFGNLAEGLGEDTANLAMFKALGGTPDDEDQVSTDGDELFVPEEERAAIVAYTGLWQLCEVRVRNETPALRAARLELRRRLDASDAGDRPTEGEEWTPVSGDKEQELLHEIHGEIRERLPQLDPMSTWGGPMRSIVHNLGTALGRHATTEVGDRKAELGLNEEEIDRLAGWIAFRVTKEFESIDTADEALKAITEANRLGETMRALLGDIALRPRDRQAVALVAKDELGSLDDDPEGQKIANAVIAAWGSDNEREATVDA